MLLEVLTPEKLLYRGHVDHVRMPGIDGSFGVMNQHAPLISALEAGKVEVSQMKGENKNYAEYSGSLLSENRDLTTFEFKVTGGVVEVLRDKIVILAE